MLSRQRRFFGRDDVKKSGASGPGGGGGGRGASGTGRGPDETDGTEPADGDRGVDVDASSDPRESMSFAIWTDDAKSLRADFCIAERGCGGAASAGAPLLSPGRAISMVTPRVYWTRARSRKVGSEVPRSPAAFGSAADGGTEIAQRQFRRRLTTTLGTMLYVAPAPEESGSLWIEQDHERF